MFPTAPPCTAGLDIGLILDKSLSVKKPNLITVIKFLGNLVKNFNPAPEADHFGLITFAGNAKVSFSFADSKYHSKDALLKKIASEPIVLKYGTRTDLALKMATDKLFTGAGDRSDKPNVLIVLTDGEPWPYKPFAATEKQISKDFEVCRFITFHPVKSRFLFFI